MTSIPYSDTIQAIKAECLKINISFSKEGDGRITSAIKEKEYLDALTKGLLENYTGFTVEIPKERFWYDIMINSIPINLKLTSGGTDNAFNKVAIIYTVTGSDCSKRNMNYDDWFNIIKDSKKKDVRNKQTEYHYLVVHKDTGQILLKSILDIHTYKTNPCNILQINWNNEFKNIDCYIPDSRFKSKTHELIRTVQNSLKQYVNSMKTFCDADISSAL
jgi:hypothetical protein